MSGTWRDDPVQRVIHGIVFEEVLVGVFTAIYAEVPWLATPVLKQVFEFCVTKLTELIYDKIAQSVSFIIIDFKTAEQRAAYESAVAEVKKAQEAQDAVQMELAKDNFRRTLRDLIRLPH